MSISELVQVSGYFLLFLSCVTGLGIFTVSIITKRINLADIGVYILIGLGMLGNLALVLGLGASFTRTNILIIASLGIVLGAWQLVRLRRLTVIPGKNLIKAIKTDLLATLCLVFAVISTATLYFSAMQPPHATDELHYHFPQARQIAQTATINWSFDGHYFYGNIPKLVDVLFGVGLTVQGYQLAHLLNYTFLIGFVLLVMLVVYRRYGYRSGVFAVLLLLLFEDFTWNATVGFVDSATSTLEIGSLLLLITWLDKKKNDLLLMSGLLIGFSLGAKYSPLPTALFMTIIVLSVSIRDKTGKYMMVFSVPALLAGGYWYVKNWILFGNPFYPMYFGHKGVSEESYQSLMEAIWQWEAKTGSVFLAKLSRWRTYSELSTYLAIWVSPLAIWWGKKDKFLALLSLYFMLYVPYWFFFATHQTRFLLTALLVANIVLAIMLAKLPAKIIGLGIMGLLATLLYIRPYPGRTLLEHYIWMKLHTVERQYGLGNVTETEYLHREFGCQYDAINYLNHLEGKEKVIDNWSVWHAPSLGYFAAKNKFVIYTPSDTDLDEIFADLKANSIGYLYVNTNIRSQYLQNTDSIVEKTKPGKLRADEVFIPRSQLVFEVDTCKVYKLVY